MLYPAKESPNMFDYFERFLREKITISDHEMKLVHSVTVEKRLRKKQYLLQEGEVCRQNCFIVNGCLRMYRIADDGAEHMLRFAIENWWMSDRESMTTGRVSQNNIDALEDSDLLLWTKPSFDMLTNEIPAFRDYIADLLAKSFNASQQRIYINISATAEEKYLAFIKSSPRLFNRIPLHMIASYLGVSSKTLSRIRQHFAHTPKLSGQNR
jgi:CRP-like cAMP-binding protein